MRSPSPTAQGPADAACVRAAHRSFLPVGRFGGARLTDGGSDEGGFEELEEFWFSRALLEFAQAIEPLRVMFLEEPIQLEGNDTLAWLGERAAIPLATGERHTTKWMFEDLISRHLVSYVQPDVIQCGGITELKKIAAMAEAQFIDVAPHCPSSLSTGLRLASLHVNAATANCVIQKSHPNPTGSRLEMFSGRAVNIKDGYAELPMWPGLGLKLNEEEAKKFPPTRPNPAVYFDDGSVADY